MATCEEENVEHTSELELEVRIMRNIRKCNVMMAEKSFTFLLRQGLGKVCLHLSNLFLKIIMEDVKTFH